MQVQDAKEYLQNELQHSQILLEKLQEYSERVQKTVDQIDAAYEHVFQQINSKEKLLCDKVNSSATQTLIQISNFEVCTNNQ